MTSLYLLILALGNIVYLVFALFLDSYPSTAIKWCLRCLAQATTGPDKKSDFMPGKVLLDSLQ